MFRLHKKQYEWYDVFIQNTQEGKSMVKNDNNQPKPNPPVPPKPEPVLPPPRKRKMPFSLDHKQEESHDSSK